MIIFDNEDITKMIGKKLYKWDTLVYNHFYIFSGGT